MQSTEQKPEIVANLSLSELTALLIKNQGLHEGLYNIAITFQIGVGAVGPKNGLPASTSGKSLKQGSAHSTGQRCAGTSSPFWRNPGRQTF